MVAATAATDRSDCGIAIEQLDYEQTLGALQDFLGRRVIVSFGDAESGFSAGDIVGTLHSATDIDLAAMLPVLDGEFAGETMVFRVLPADLKPDAFGGFAIWREGFQSGQRVLGLASGVAISLRVGGLVIRVRPMPPIPGLE